LKRANSPQDESAVADPQRKRSTSISNAADTSQPVGRGAVLQLWITKAERPLLLLDEFSLLPVEGLDSGFRCNLRFALAANWLDELARFFPN
jgi:hypothetical protein